MAETLRLTDRATLEKYEERSCRCAADSQGEAYAARMGAEQAAIRDAARAGLPHSVYVEGPDIAIEVAARWCWRNFGEPQEEECGDHCCEYPGCPLVLATEVMQTGTDHEGNEWCEPTYSDPGKHGHQGTWGYINWDKIGYDEFAGEFCFADHNQRDAFLAVCTTLGLGERHGGQF